MQFNIDCRPADGPENCGTLAERKYIDPLRSAIFIGEIEAHGLAAASAADAIRARTRGLILRGDGVAATLGPLHEYFNTALINNGVSSARLFLGVVDTSLHRLHYGSAGFEGASTFGRPNGQRFFR